MCCISWTIFSYFCPELVWLKKVALFFFHNMPLALCKTHWVVQFCNQITENWITIVSFWQQVPQSMIPQDHHFFQHSDVGLLCTWCTDHLPLAFIEIVVAVHQTSRTSTGSTSKKIRTWTHDFVCLSETTDSVAQQTVWLRLKIVSWCSNAVVLGANELASMPMPVHHKYANCLSGALVNFLEILLFNWSQYCLVPVRCCWLAYNAC